MISHILFDLDNTLYPASTGFEDRIVRLMVEFAARHIGISVMEADELRAKRLSRYGTTMEWLRREHGPLDPDEFFACVHPEGEESILSPDPALRALLLADPRRKSIFTNAPSEHAERVLERLGIADCFEAVFDIRFSAFKGKPAPEAFSRLLDRLGEKPASVAFFDDSPRAIRAFSALGGHAFLVDDMGIHSNCGLPSLSSIHNYQEVLPKEPC